MRLTFAVSSNEPNAPYIADMTFDASTAFEVIEVLNTWLKKHEDYYIYEIKPASWYRPITPMDQILGPLGLGETVT